MHLMRYQKAPGYLYSDFHVSSNTVASYSLDSMIIIFEQEQVPHQAMSGLSTFGGSVAININGLGADVNTAARLDLSFLVGCFGRNFGRFCADLLVSGNYKER